MDLLKKLGREARLDPRDQKYLIKNHVRLAKTSLTQRYWADDVWWGDQGDTPYCVGYSWAHWFEDGPVLHKGRPPKISPIRIYENAQRLDEWIGEDYEGSSVRGGVKYLKSVGAVNSYYWAFDINTITQYLLTKGPIVVGTDWTEGMFYPDKDGLIKASGEVVGGHAYVLNGVDLKTRRFRIKNSWGRSWGKMGRAFIRFSDMATLIARQGEACVAKENPDSLINWRAVNS
jgi:hypothetical protein